MPIAHAQLGASSAHRWMVCPGSVALSDGMPDSTSEHAEEGTRAHALAEHCLLNGDDPFEFLGEAHPDPEHADHEVPANMVEAVTVYVDFVRSIAGRRVIPAENVERRVSLEKLGDWAQGMFGTGDFVYRDGTVLHVADYKHGQGVVVEAEGNRQFMYYGLGALLDEEDDGIEEVHVHVVQPRAYHPDGPVRSDRHGADDLVTWGHGDVKAAVLAAEQDDAPLVPGEAQCRWCKAKGVCPALAQDSLESAMLEFGDDGNVRPLVPLDKLTAEQVANILDNEKAIKDWLAGVARLAQDELMQGRDVTNGHYKLVTGRSVRKWASEEVAETKLFQLGLDANDCYTRKFITPAQAEKLIGKEGKQALTELVVKEEGKPTLAKADDKRPALNRGPEADFS